ncbi:MAG: FxsA family protein, partial [Gammaproteobacteria bacterium]|nr:FxsA family protein [Gammaproteobacteria bacterium]
VRRAGLHTLAKGRNKLQNGELPQAEVVEGLLLMIAGALLLTPGLITDIAGFLILVPLLRKAIANYSLKKIIPSIISPNPSTDGTTQWQSKTTIIEGEFKDLDPHEVVLPNQIQDDNK